MLDLLEKPNATVQVDFRSPSVCAGLETSIKSHLVPGEELNAIESQSWTELKGLRAELDQLLFELTLTLRAYRL